MDKTFFALIHTFEEVIDKVILNDYSLIRSGQERALSFRIGMYLSSYFPGWDTDCEYNRQGFSSDPKRDHEDNIKRPDIIVHHRGLEGIDNNLLWAEIKINNSDNSNDLSKIKEFTSPPTGTRIIQYNYGLSLSFIPDINLLWAKNGEILS